MIRWNEIVAFYRNFLRSQSSKNDSGSSLIEVVAAVGILGVAVIGVVSALSTALAGAQLEKRLTTSDAILYSYHDSIVASGTYTECATPEDYTPEKVSFVAEEGYIVKVSAVTLWDGKAEPATFQPVPPNCNYRNDLGVQRLTLSVVSEQSPGKERTLDFVWRRP